MRARQLERALEAFQDAAAAAAATGSGAAAAAPLLAAARAALALGDVARCRAACASLLEADPGSEAAASMLADIMTAEGNVDGALLDLAKLLELRPRRFEALAALLALLRRAGRLDEGARYVEAAKAAGAAAVTAAAAASSAAAPPGGGPGAPHKRMQAATTAPQDAASAAAALSPAADDDAGGLHFCRGLLARWRGRPDEALREFGAARAAGGGGGGGGGGSSWAARASAQMVELHLCLDDDGAWAPDGGSASGSGAFSSASSGGGVSSGSAGDRPASAAGGLAGALESWSGGLGGGAKAAAAAAAAAAARQRDERAAAGAASAARAGALLEALRPGDIGAARRRVLAAYVQMAARRPGGVEAALVDLQDLVASGDCADDNSSSSGGADRSIRSGSGRSDPGSSAGGSGVSPCALLALARAFALARQPAKALPLLKRLAALPASASAAAGGGGGDDDGAAADAVEAGCLALARAQAAAGRLDHAAELAERCLARNRGAARAWEVVAEVAERRGRPAEAAAAYDAAWRLGGR